MRITVKFADLPTTTRGGRRLELENGIISGTSLSIADHGVLDGNIMIKFNGSGCGFGGYVLAKLDEPLGSSGKNYAGYYITRLLQTVGAERWEELPGKPVRCLHEGLGGGIVAVGNFIEDRWFCPRLEFEDGFTPADDED